VALIIHSQQTEATYRLDFLWKLQATGKTKHSVIGYTSHCNSNIYMPSKSFHIIPVR
jgi:hypothetical protein